MNMDMTDEQQQAQDHPPSWSQILYGDQDVNIFEDQAATPAPRSSASHHANKVKQGEAEARHGRNLDQLQDQARHEANERAYDQAMREISAGRDLSPKVAEQAMRHLRQQGGMGLSTAQQLASRAGRS